MKINVSSTHPTHAPSAAGPNAAPREKSRPEGKKANAAVRKVSDGFCTNPTCLRTTDHNTFKCAVPCAIPACPTKDIPHPAKSCFLLRSKELSGPYFQSFEVCSPIVPLHPTRRRSPPPTRRDLEKPWRSTSTWRQIPPIKFDTGANVFVSPIPLVEAPLQPCDDVIHVANGDAVAITSTTSLGNQLCYIAPTFDYSTISYRIAKCSQCTL